MKRIISILLLLLAAQACALAGGIIGIDGATGRYLTPTLIDVKTTIQNQVATTVARQRFTNSAGAEARIHFFFPTSINAVVTGFRWWQNGKLRVARISGTPQDTAALGTGTGSGGTPSTLDRYLGASPFIFPFSEGLAADSSIEVELTYIELLRYGGGRVNYSFPADLGTFGAPPAELRFQLSLESTRDILSMTATSHPDIVVQQSARTARAALNAGSFALTHDIEISYVLAQTQIGVSMLSIKPSGEDGYFLMLAEPDPKTSQQKVIDKTFTFIIDVSGSMFGTKLEQAKSAAIYTIEHLNPEDRFNVIAFSSDARKFQNEPAPATLANERDARSFINNLSAQGGTNLELPLLLGLGQSLPDTTANIIVFLTDGIASLDQSKIATANTRSTRIFVFGIGQDVNQTLLTQLAAGNNGLAEFLGTDDVTTRVSAFYNKIRNPLLQNTQIAFSAGGVYEVYPVPLPDIYVGEQLVMLGRYTTPGPARATLTGQAFGRPQTYDYDVTFTGDSVTNLFIPKMWAKYKIDALLVLMKKVAEGSNQWKEWRGEIIRLSKLYGILSPFSSFSDPGNGGGSPSGVEEEDAGSSIGQHGIAVATSPNPFTATMTILFRVPDDVRVAHATVTIYDMQGNVVAVLYDAPGIPGEQIVHWDGRDARGALAPAGVYMCRVRIGDRAQSERIVMVR